MVSLASVLRAVPSADARAKVAQVLPSLRDQRDEKLLRELHRRWDNHNVMTRWLSRFFNYLDRCAMLEYNAAFGLGLAFLA